MTLLVTDSSEAVNGGVDGGSEGSEGLSPGERAEALEELLGTVIPEGRARKLEAVLVGCPSTTSVLNALAVITREQFDDEKGAALLRAFARTFAEHEVDAR
jgi:hypothetical protein